MASPFRRFKNFVAYSVAALVLLLAAAWWLWGDSARHHLAAFSGAARTEALKAEPYGIRREAIDGQIDQAKREAQELAEAIGQLQGQLTTVDESIERLEQSQGDDREVLEALNGFIHDCPPDGVVTLDGTAYARHELRSHAALCFDRYRSRLTQIETQEAHRNEVEATMESLRTTLRDRLARIRTLETGQKHAMNLVEQNRFNRWVATLDGYRLDSESLTHAERDQEKLLQDLTRRSVGLKVMNELLQGGSTPAIDAIVKESEPPIEEQIEELLSQFEDN